MDSRPAASSPLSSSVPPRMQELPGPAARLCLDVRRFMERELAVNLRGRLLLLAVSGGADSLALLTVLCALRPCMGHEVRVAHIDHGLREESAAEAGSVRALCQRWGIACTVRAAPVGHYARQHGLGLEDAGRTLRYALLREERERHGAAWLCTGHHSHDLQEDVLLRLLRGTGWPALGGMAALDAQRRLLRPLLHTDPQALRDLLRSCGLNWTEDPSNADTRFARNRLRHDLLPLLRQESPALDGHTRHLWRMAQADAEHWQKIMDSLLAAHHVTLSGPRVHLPASLLTQADAATRLRLYMRAVRHLGQGQARAATLFALDDAWKEGRGGTIFQLPGGICASLRRRAVTFEVSVEKKEAHTK